jgi:hypothetical protein
MINYITFCRRVLFPNDGSRFLRVLTWIGFFAVISTRHDLGQRNQSDVVGRKEFDLRAKKLMAKTAEPAGLFSL